MKSGASSMSSSVVPPRERASPCPLVRAPVKQSYEEFVSSVFAAMGIPADEVQNVSTDPKAKMAFDDRSVTRKTKPRREVKTEGPNEGKATDSSDGKSGDLDRSGRTARAVQTEAKCSAGIDGETTFRVYKKVHGNKMVRTERHLLSDEGSERRADSVAAGLCSKSDTRARGPLCEGVTDPRQLCQSYCQTGTCSWKDRCRFAHDPQRVRICPSWLHDRYCIDLRCPLQHVIRRDLLPHCAAYQTGLCAKAGCPLLHTMYDPKAPPCVHFQRSYCPRGAHCWRRHTYQAN